MEPTPTPVPWEIVENKYGIEICGVGDSEGQVWQIIRIDAPCAKQISNMKIIVKAVNAYAANRETIKLLVEAVNIGLTMAEVWEESTLEPFTPQFYKNKVKMAEAIDRARSQNDRT